MHCRARAVAAVSLAVAAAALLFVRLDQRLLWVDEAETALLGRNILSVGVPKAFDGRHLISQEVGREFGEDTVWRWTPWLDKYIAAASFAVLGESTFSARLPFALLGWIAVVSMLPLGSRVFCNRWVGILAMAFLTFSVPFLLHARQCRYYSPAVLAWIWTAYFFLGLPRQSRAAVAGLAASMTALFHSNTLICVATALALAPSAVALRFDRRAYRRGALAALLFAAINAPWVYYFGLAQPDARIYTIGENLLRYLALTNLYSFPFAALLVVVACVSIRSRHALLEGTERPGFAFLLVFSAFYLAAVSAAPWSFYRYTLPLIPVGAILAAFLCVRLTRWSRTAGGLFTVLMLFTALFQYALAWALPISLDAPQMPGRTFRSFDVLFPLGNYGYEVSRAYRGPMERLVELLDSSAKPGDRVFISYGDLTLMFHTDLEIRGGQSGRRLDDWGEPGWIVVRSFFRFGDRPALRADAERTRDWIRHGVAREHYEDVPASWTDVPWDNIAEPHLHWFREPTGGHSMLIYRLK